jgi:tetratricopeptide (TPR) repeat protein
MPIYRHDRLPGGSHYIRQTTWEDEAAGAVVGGAASAAGWLIGSGISGLTTLARNSKDRRLIRAAAALEEASDAPDDDRFLELAADFTDRYPKLADGFAYLSQALQRKGQYDRAINAVDDAEQLGLDETAAHALRADIYDDAEMTGKAIQEYTIVSNSQIAKDHPEIRVGSILGRANLMLRIGDLDQAIRDADEAVSIMPIESSYFIRGHVHRRRGDLQKALDDYSRAIQLLPDEPNFWVNRAEVYEMLGKESNAQADRAAASARKVETSPESATSEVPPVRATPHATEDKMATGRAADSDLEGLQKFGPIGMMAFGAFIFLIAIASGSGAGAAFAFILLLAGGIWKVASARR